MFLLGMCPLNCYAINKYEVTYEIDWFRPKFLGASLTVQCYMHCRNKGIFFVAIDRSRPLSDQGPFDVVLHKVRVDFSIGKPKLLIVYTFLFSIDRSKTQVVIYFYLPFFCPILGKGWKVCFTVCPCYSDHL